MSSLKYQPQEFAADTIFCYEKGVGGKNSKYQTNWVLINIVHMTALGSGII